jgi:hypothetical protein
MFGSAAPDPVVRRLTTKAVQKIFATFVLLPKILTAYAEAFSSCKRFVW